MQRASRTYWVLFAFALLIAPGCRRSAPVPDAAPETSEEVLSASIQLKGSDTMVNLGQAWAEAFMKRHPQVRIAVTGGGSGTGIAALINGTTDIAESSREMKPEEREQAKARGNEVVEHKVALDGLTVAVHPSNPVKRLTIAQLSELYTGKFTNWKELGGADRPIVALSREKNSGTHVFFLEHVVRRGNAKGPEQFAPGVLMMASSQTIADEVASNPNAIGYFGLGYLDRARHQPIAVAADEQSEYVEPSSEAAATGKYAIARPLFLYTRADANPAVKAFVEFVLSPDGQKIVAEQEFVPLSATDASRSAQ
ncbi:MAG: PstS family phosphate ABC transporter substrate-binding protein [Armatimonadota bacterium]|nr:PstS family phosphate ABC transporter substrate-binding protein [Armatimonadota bacterium]